MQSTRLRCEKPLPWVTVSVLTENGLAGRIARGDDDHRNAGDLRVAGFLLQYLETVDIRHIQVKQQEIGAALPAAC